MNGISIALAAKFVVLIVLQVAAIAVMPRTRGFTNLGATVAMLTTFATSYWLMARMIQRGTNLGILIPLMAAVVPLASVATGIIFYGESTSPLKIALLACACILVGIAARC